jgi:hypothetical protein
MNELGRITMLLLKAVIRALFHRAAPVFPQNRQPMAKQGNAGINPAISPRPAPGMCKGAIVHMAPDFDAPLEEMKEYM